MNLPYTSTSRRQKTFSILILVCASILAYLALIQPWALRQDVPPLAVGDVATQDLRAPHDVRYVSEVLTEAARVEAERAVAAVYTPPDPTIARSQVEALNATLQAIDAIRSNAYWNYSEKKAALAKISTLTLEPSSYDLLLTLTEAHWDAVKREALNVLDQIMRNPVRSEALDAIRQGLPAQVSYTLTEGEAEIVVGLVLPFIKVNSFYSPEQTEMARQAARNAVEPVIQSYVSNQMVVSRGQVITPADLEALTVLGLVKAESPAYKYAGAAALVLISVSFTLLYFFRSRAVPLLDLRSLLVLSLLFVTFLLVGRVVIPNRVVLPYLFPLPAFALLISSLFGMERGMVFGLLMSVLTAYGMPETFSLLAYYSLTSMCGVLALGQARRLAQFLYAALAVAVVGLAVIVAYRLPFTEMDTTGRLTLMAAAVGAGSLSAILALPLQFLLAQFLGLMTAFQLLEISRPDSSLLNHFLQRAPGTYQHSLQVANLAEQAAERIQADALLTRVGALFHDIGKSANPLFFVENQPPSQIDSHDELDPQESAETIIRHVTDGLAMARKHHLPQRLHDFIAEHHGTLVTLYQYNRALELAGGDPSKVDEGKFRYPGPTPRSKETALLMLADGVEARARAERPTTDDEIREIVNNVVERCRKDGQLDQAPLSQRDLALIRDSFVNVLRVTYHPRLEYPREPFETKAEPSTQPRVKGKRHDLY